MNFEDLNNKILIIKDNEKKYILESINKLNKLINVNIITLSELKKKYYFDYSKETLYYLCNKYNLSIDVGKIYLNNMYYINDKSDYSKVNNLIEIKRDLENNNLLEYNYLFHEFLKNKDIILYNLKYIDKFYLNIFEELKQFNNIISIDEEYDKNIIDVYKCSNKDEEISFVASKICELIKNGININDIYLSNVPSEYYYSIHRIFSMFNIPVILETSKSIKGTNIVKCFKDNYSNDLNNTLDKVKLLVKSSDDELVYNKIIDVINDYSFSNNYKSIKKYIFNDIDNSSIKINEVKNAVRIINVKDENICNKYIFLMSFNEGIIPVNYKDEDYFNDKIKESLNISTSYDLNLNEGIEYKNKILSNKNIIITYKEYSANSKVYISSLFDSNNFNLKDVEKSYIYSNDFNMIKLVSLKDNYNKYGSICDDLIVLNTNYKDEKYLTYDNKYHDINNNDVYNYLNNEITLSYSSINTYYKCEFRYYLDNVLRLNKYKDTFEITIGNIFHKILSKCFVDDFDFETNWNKECLECKYEFEESDKYFLDKLKGELVLIIDTIKNQLKYTSLNKSMYEKRIVIDVNKDLHITFKGFVDKILYNEFDGQTIVAIVDYKTGNPELNIDNVVYGLDMQLPVYIYLIKNEIKDVKIGGFYLQKILNSYTNIDEKINSLKLQGYSNSNIDILSKVDSGYSNSNVIKSMKLNSSGEFSRYAKVISDDEIDILYNEVDSRIKEAANNIYNARFDINPKQIEDNNVGCLYCKYKDICYRSNEDIVNIPKAKKIIGGNEDGIY